MTGRKLALGFNWEKLGNGLVVPCGSTERHQTTLKDAHTYLSVKEQVVELRSFFDQLKVVIPKHSSLEAILAAGVRLSDEWLLGGGTRLTRPEIFTGAICSRVVQAALVLRAEPDRTAQSYLKKLLRGSLDLLDRRESEAKNFLWELETLIALRGVKALAALGEPDVVVQSPAGPIGLACKKIYSEENVSKVLSTGVRQIERSGLPGILALNLDEWAPANAILRVRSFDELRMICNQNNDRFLSAHSHDIEKYCTPGRAIAIYVSSGLMASVESATAGLSNATQAVLWSSTRMPEDKLTVARAFMSLFPKDS